MSCAVDSARKSSESFKDFFGGLGSDERVWVVVRTLVGDPSRGDTAYLKDALMVIAMAVLIVAVPADCVGGIGNPLRSDHADAP
jgi:hypothetical protein